MATRRNVAGTGSTNSNGHLPPSLQAGSPTGTSAPPTNVEDDDEVPSLVDTAPKRTYSALDRMKGGIVDGGIGKPVNFHVLAPRPSSPSQQTNDKLEMWERQYYPGESRALSGIARRGFLLGNAASAGVALTIYLLYNKSLFWRLPAFIVALSIFHFMEFWTTARYNTPSAQVSSYLLSSNGHAWTVAHTSAFTECLLTCLYKTYGLPFTLPPIITAHLPSLPTWLFPAWDTHLNVILGLLLVVGGQIIRSLAMAQAGQSFNHVVQFRRQKSHTLVTHGVYSISRHPSYFGFFWWGLGTQLLLGNVVCFLGYAGVLWLFFKKRIEGEEKFLVNFFREDYVEYRKRVGVWIPFI